MASFATLHGLNGPLLRSKFLGQDHKLTKHHPSTSSHHSKPNLELLQPHAKFNLVEIMGGRGICNGEMGIQKELEKKVEIQPQQESVADGGREEGNSIGQSVVAEDGFEKEMMGLTGGFPGGEKGLLKFIEENPPQKPATVSGTFNLEESKAMVKN